MITYNHLIFLCCNCVSITTWMLTKQDGNYTRMLCAFEQIMEAVPKKTVVIWPPTSHLTNQVNLSRVILCLEVRALHSLYVYIYIFVQ